MTIRLSSKEQEDLILKNLKLVHYIVKKMNVSYVDYDDIVSIGNMGLIKAASTFDKSKGLAFSTYASRCIRNEILMYFRKENKYANIISIDDPIAKDKDGNEMTIADTLADPNENFVEKFAEREEGIKLLSIVLNLFESKRRLLMLYKIAGMKQEFIAKTLNLSQSYVSRLEKKIRNELKLYFTTSQQYKEVFKMEIVGDSYKITFSSRDIKNFNMIFATFLQELTSAEDLPDFKVSCNKERIIIQVPAHPESFSFIAQIIKEIDDYNLTFVSDEGVSTVNDNVLKKVITDGNNQNVAEQNEVEVIKKTKTIKKKQSVSAEASLRTANFTGREGSYAKQVREYMLSKKTFSTEELRKHFPDLSSVTVRTIIYNSKKRGYITSIGRGKYTINKK